MPPGRAERPLPTAVVELRGEREREAAADRRVQFLLEVRLEDRQIADVGTRRPLTGEVAEVVTRLPTVANWLRTIETEGVRLRRRLSERVISIGSGRCRSAHEWVARDGGPIRRSVPAAQKRIERSRVRRSGRRDVGWRSTAGRSVSRWSAASPVKRRILCAHNQGRQIVLGYRRREIGSRAGRRRPTVALRRGGEGISSQQSQHTQQRWIHGKTCRQMR